MSEQWDVEVDYLVAGTGVAGLSAAITAKLNGLDTLVVESMDKWGGTTAISGGGLWVPNNPLMIRDGEQDTPEKAFDYLNATIGDLGPWTSDARKWAFINGYVTLRSVKLLSDQVTEREITIVLRELRRLSAVPGDVVEFGCFVGTTSVHLAQEIAEGSRTLYLYDSFAGLPEKRPEDVSPAGEQFRAGELLATKKELIRNLKQAHVPMPIIKKAWFTDLVPTDIPTHIAFAFLDGDYHDSIRDPLRLIWDRLTPGAVIVIDDYANEALPGAARATDEWLRNHSVKSFRVESSLAIIYT